MISLKDYETLVCTGAESGINLIISGAGMHPVVATASRSDRLWLKFRNDVVLLTVCNLVIDAGIS